MPVEVAGLLFEDRPAAVRVLGVEVSPEWPAPDLAGVLQRHAAALVRWAQTRPGVRAVVAGCDPGNAASAVVLGRAGFVRDGEAGGELRWRVEAAGK